MKKLLIALFVICAFFSAHSYATELRDYDFDQGRMLTAADTVYVVSTFDTYDYVNAYDYYGSLLWEVKFYTKIISWQATTDYVLVFSKNRIGNKTFLSCLDRLSGRVIWERS